MRPAAQQASRAGRGYSPSQQMGNAQTANSSAQRHNGEPAVRNAFGTREQMAPAALPVSLEDRAVREAPSKKGRTTSFEVSSSVGLENARNSLALSSAALAHSMLGAGHAGGLDDAVAETFEQMHAYLADVNAALTSHSHVPDIAPTTFATIEAMFPFAAYEFSYDLIGLKKMFSPPAEPALKGVADETDSTPMRSDREWAANTLRNVVLQYQREIGAEGIDDDEEFHELQVATDRVLNRIALGQEISTRSAPAPLLQALQCYNLAHGYSSDGHERLSPGKMPEASAGRAGNDGDPAFLFNKTRATATLRATLSSFHQAATRTFPPGHPEAGMMMSMADYIKAAIETAIEKGTRIKGDIPNPVLNEAVLQYNNALGFADRP